MERTESLEEMKKSYSEENTKTENVQLEKEARVDIFYQSPIMQIICLISHRKIAKNSESNLFDSYFSNLEQRG